MPPSNPQRARPELQLTAGPRAAEATLLADLTEHLQAPERWTEPLILVVPSRTLREHLQSRIVAHHGAVLGVRSTTLFGLALEVTEDIAGQLLAGRDLFPLFARRLGRLEPALQRALESLSDGYATLLGPARDLLDAGLDPALADGMIEALTAEGRSTASAQEVQRAAALVRVASRTIEELAAVGAGRRSTLLTAAAERIRLRGQEALAARHLWVYGFADASGVARDLIEALLDRFEGRLYLDQPPDPADPDRPDAGIVFTRRFRERLESRGAFSALAGSAQSPPPPRVELFRALGSDSEVREVGRRIRGLLDDGARPEGITIVARQLPPYARAVRQHFTSLGLPFSTSTALGAKDRLGRRAEALADLLERQGEVSVERWLELVDRRFEARSHADLRTGFATLGVGRLREAAALAADPYRREHRLRLPVRHGFEEVLDEHGHGQGLRLRYRYLPAAALTQATTAAAALDAHFAAWTAVSSLRGHLDAFDALVREHLSWPDDQADGRLVMAVREIWSALPQDFDLKRDEFATTVAARLREVGAQPLGGQGGGIQILDVVEARGLTSEHLFLLGLNRGVFPRIVTEDPLLPDSLRGVLSRQGAGVLPDLPDKLAGFDEERFLFAQLLASSPHVTLSWQDTDDDQMPLAPSPLLERLRWVSEDETWHEPVLARAVVAQAAAVPRSPLENGIAVALAGSRSRLVDALPLLLGEGPPASAAVAAARAAVLNELDPSFDSDRGRDARQQLGPYYGFLGAARAGDPRAEQQLYVTSLERLSGCPWQLALRRLLGLEPVPDPLAALPGITPLLIGGLVHDVLEQIVLRGLADPSTHLARARQRIPQPVPWPEPNELDDLVYRSAEALCRREGIAVEGFARVLVQAVAPHLEMARELDWSAPGGLHVLGAEIHGELEVHDAGGKPRSIHFRADRLDLGADGLLLTDYKTGKRAVSTAKNAATRRRHLLDSVWRGERLQAVAYALAAGEPGDAGRYLFIGPEVAEEADLRDVRIDAGDEGLEAAFERAAGATIATWDLGTFFPRLVLPDRDEEPARCEYCEVRDACLRGDSGARRRLADWTATLHQRFTSKGKLSAQELTLLSLWQLPTEGHQ